MTGYAGGVILPRTAALRPQLARDVGLGAAEEAARAEFGRLHARAVQLNALTLLCGLGVLGAVAGVLRAR
jgi:hypothetical protein